MVNDLYLNKTELLKCWMRNKVVFATHDVIKWGMDNYYCRANRTKQDFRQHGIIRTLTDFEKAGYGFKCKDDVYKWIGGNDDKTKQE